MPSTILVPLDGSPRAERALGYAEHLGRTVGARLVLLLTRPTAVEVHDHGTTNSATHALRN
jgi:nucleotide-binding universal stress UspA family protein